MVASDDIGHPSKAAVLWFANVRRRDSFDFYGRNDCKQQNIQRQNCIKVYSSLHLGFARSKMNMREARDLIFFPFGIVVYLYQHLWIVNIVYDARMQSRMQHAKNGRVLHLLSLPNSSPLFLCCFHHHFLIKNCFFLWKQVY